MNRVFRVMMATTLFGTIACSSLKNSDNSSQAFILQVSTSPCFGRCPVYKLSINSNGNAIYTGLRHPKTKGDVQRTIPATEIDSIRYILEKYDFWDLDSIYDNPNVSDMPSFIVEYKGEIKSKTVVGRFESPDNFRRISAFLERLRKRNFGDLENN